MAKSKADLSFVLLFAFLLTSHVLAHTMSQDAPQNQDWYDDDGSIIIDNVNPTSTQDLEKNYWRDGSRKPGFRHFVGHGYETPRLEDVEKRTRPYNAEVDELGEPDGTFPQAPRKSMFESRSSHHTHSTTYDPSNLEVNEPKKTRHRIHGPKTHPKPNSWRAFREIQAGTYAKNYSGGSTMKDVEPKNYTDYSVTRHGNMERHASPEYFRAFREFQARTYGRIDGGVPKMEDFGEETEN